MIRDIVYSLLVWYGAVFPSSFLYSCTHASGDKSARFMMVAKDNSSTGAKTGVVAPVPFNTPSLRQEIHGSLGDNAAIASINRSSAGGGWGSAAGAASASAGNPDQAGGGKGRGRGVGGSRSQGGDDVFTRHFPDLRAGLEQAERLDAETKASSKVAPIRKPKPEPAKDHGPSLRPRGTDVMFVENFSMPFVLLVLYATASNALE